MALRRLPLSGYSANVMEFMHNPDDPDRWDLNAPYQRDSVWTDEQRRLLIRSLMIGLPVGAISISLRGHDNPHPNPNVQGVVVDGKQRLTTLRAFYNSEFGVPARWFENDGDPAGDFLPGDVDLDGDVTYAELTDVGQRLWFRSCTLSVVEATGLTTEQEADWYLAINFGGVAQTDADRQRAVEIAGLSGAE